MSVGLRVKCVLFLSHLNQNWIWWTDFSANHQYKIWRISVHWEPSCSVPTDWPTHTMNLRWLFAFLLRTRLKIAELITGCVFVPALKKLLAMKLLDHYLPCSLVSMQRSCLTAQAWMACVAIMLTSRCNESVTVHSLRVQVLSRGVCLMLVLSIAIPLK